jgi:hypothetical protein
MSEKTDPSGYVEFNFTKKNLDKIEPLDYTAEINPKNEVTFNKK